MRETLHNLQLTWEQFDALEEAADIMALGHHYVDTLEEALHYLAKKYIDEYEPQFETSWIEVPPTPPKV